MLKHLLVKNYAIIDNLEIDFHSGLNIITGETGAGKSILLGALGLILGNRAEANILKDKENSCIVEGTFNLQGYNLEPLFEENDLDFQPNTIIRRHISQSGKSRAFVNELPVTLTLLKDIVGRVIDIHSQHQNLLLVNANFQLLVLDSFANTGALIDEYKELYSLHKQLTDEFNELTQKSAKAKADLDYLQFQLNQLNEAKLVEGEEADLELLQQQLSHSEDIKIALHEVVNYCNADETSILIWLKNVQESLNRISSFYPMAIELNKRVEACRIELKDIAQEGEMQSEKIELDPSELERVNQRLDNINTLMQKHRVTTVTELIAIRDELQIKVDEIVDYDSTVERKAKKISEISSQAFAKAKIISNARVNVCGGFESSIQLLLTQLGMPFANFKVSITHHDELLPNGIDRATFLFSANKQGSLQELSKVASGGELSRLMLSLKSLMVKAKGLPTIILDEIDTGVSGDIADKVGNIIHDMSKGMQVINITHLPQIASKGTTHFLVYKEDDSVSSTTHIRLLKPNERVLEIAKMLSGEQVFDAAIINAKHLLANGK
ncbi:MAG: DNA repair protein RecN [Bacteroidales bacterium]|nr:DNA repair protein RecN [Bacteroidales bacterium]MDD4385168.1 DNA repair protein RecN [Bacteroidales bacterium]MDY0197148.1 DNA repair protein RecN [Tenuifilaceae bacterium]